MLKVWIEKMLGCKSPTAAQFGFDYLYDYLKARKEVDRAIRRAKRHDGI